MVCRNSLSHIQCMKRQCSRMRQPRLLLLLLLWLLLLLILALGPIDRQRGGLHGPAQPVLPQRLHLGRQLPEQPAYGRPGAFPLRPPLQHSTAY